MPLPSLHLWSLFRIFNRARQQAHDAEVAGLKAELAHARQAAADAHRAHHACLTRTTHEMRTPLNAVLGYTQLLLNDAGLTRLQAAKLAHVERAGQHLLTLVEEILDLSCMEAGTFTLHTAPLALPAWLADTADMVRPLAEQKGLALRLDASGLPDAVVADGQRLRQVLLNLLANALRFTDAGRVSLRASAAAGPADAARVRFEVADTGVGIDAQELPALFQPFRQVGDAAQRGGGTGLGLTISRQLVRAMGGEIEVRSAPGQGSCFAFTLDLPRAAGAAAHASRPENLAPA